MRKVITHDKIRIGDTIEIAYVYGDVKRTIEATITSRQRYGHSTDYVTQRGYEVLTVFRSGDMKPAGATITLLHHKDMAEVPLPGMDELMEEVAGNV